MIFSKYATYLKTTISQKSLSNLGLLLLLFKFHNFSLLIDIINNIFKCHVTQSASHEQCTALPLVGVLVTWYGRINNIIKYILIKRLYLQSLKQEMYKNFANMFFKNKATKVVYMYRATGKHKWVRKSGKT